uniref:GDNF/GAS1 domain-containing protein n=1 Tax=Plectus sambesii TaxID=2011161 RepID=A0A914V6L9_9BILA
MILVELLILQALHIGSAALQSCLHAQDLCSQDSSCSQALLDVYNYCGPVKETCQAPRLKKCHRALHTLHTSPVFGERDNYEDCWCYEPLGSIAECQSFRHLVFHHPCIGRIRDLQHERKFATRNGNNSAAAAAMMTLTSAALGQPLRRTTRSPMQHEIRHWKSRLSGDLKESQTLKRFDGVLACTDAL